MINIHNEIDKLERMIAVHNTNIANLKTELKKAKIALKAFKILAEKAESIEVPKEQGK